ncbi:nuclear transport factor 2 family protein [Hymenobacter daeguensis]
MRNIAVFRLLILALGLTIRTAAAQQLAKPSEEAALRLVVANYEDAWNRHDAKGLAAQYHTDATWVNWFGAYSKGQQAILEHYQTVHSTYFKPSHYYTRSIEDIAFVKPDVAIMHVRTGLTGDERYPGQTFEFRRTLVLTKRDGAWRILAGQNAKLNEGIK